MTRVAVLSDSHGDTEALDVLLRKMGTFDAACFLGDISSDADYLRAKLAALPNQPILYAVKGNNDFATTLPAEMLIVLGGKRIYLTHGHLFGGYSPSLYTLALRGREQNADIVLYGHTHCTDLNYDHGILLFNPGSAGNYCRGGKARAAVLELRTDGSVNIKDITYD